MAKLTSDTRIDLLLGALGIVVIVIVIGALVA
jgi:hypothetical protein